MKRQFLLTRMLLLFALIVGSGSNAWATPQTYNFSSLPTTGWTTSGGSQTINSKSWTYSSSTYIGNSSSRIQVGSKNNPQTSDWTISTAVSNFGSGKKITAISITAYTTETSATYDISAGGSSVKSGSLTTSSATYSVSSLNVTSGDIVITLRGSSTSKAMYLSDISVTYDDAGGSSDPSISLGSTSVNATEAAVSTTSIEVTYNNLTNYDADVIFYESDGTTNATYDHSWLTAEINATTKNLDYSITANTGASRTAYLRVYALGDEGDAESDLITITQAAKSVASPVFNLDGGSYMQGTNITISSAGNTIYYNLTTDGTTPGNPTNASTPYTEQIVLGSGKTIIKAIAYDTYGNTSSVVTRTYTGIALASLPFSWTGTSSDGKEELAEETGVAVSLGTNYAESNAPYRLKFDGAGKYVIIYTDAKLENVYFTAKLFNAASTGSKIKVQGSADGITFTDVEEFTIKGSANATFEFTTSNTFASTHRAVKLVMSSKDQNVGVGTICVNCIPVKVGAKGYATYCNSKCALDFTDKSIKAYTVSCTDGSALTLTLKNKVAKGEPVLLYSTTASDSKTIPAIAESEATADANNKLVAGDGNAHTWTAGTAEHYILYTGGAKPGFYRANNSVVAAGKAYLDLTGLPVPATAREFFTFFDDETTGINAIDVENANAEVKNNVYYNLNGQRVANPSKGLYIVNGKKVIMK